MAVALTICAAALLFVPAGIVLLGLVIGSLNALLAVGLVLVYRANRIVNFAHGETGGTAGVLTVLLVARGWNFFVAAGIGLALAALTGAVVETTIIRRFASAPRLLLTVATIGVAQVLGFVALVLPTLFDEDVVPQDFLTPLSDWRFTVDPITFTGDHVLVVAFTLAAVAGLTTLFTRSTYGLGVLASAESRDRAALCGIPVKGLSTLVWVLAALLSGAAAILQAPVIGLPIGVLVGPGLLLRGLAAAVIGRMESLPVTIVAALTLGVIEQAVFFETNESALVDLMLFGVILVGLLLQRPRHVRADPDEAAVSSAIQEVRATPSVLRGLPEVRAGAVGVVIGVLVVVVVVPWQVLSVADQNLASSIVIWALVGVSLVVLTGWAGQVSLGQFGLVGIGAAAAGSATAEHGADFIVSLGIGMIAGLLAALVLGLPALRLRGFYLAATTLAFSVAASSFLLRESWAVPSGVVERPVLFGVLDLENELTFYFVCLAVLGVVVAALRSLRASRMGRAIVAVRENPRAAQSFGINATLAKLCAFGVSGAVTGLAGGLLVHHAHRLQVEQYAPAESLQAFTMAVIGGLGSIPGAILGALYVRGFQSYVGGSWAILGTGAGLLVLLLVLPQGLGALVFSIRDWLLRAAARRRGLIVSSLLEDRRVDEVEPIESEAAALAEAVPADVPVGAPR